MRILRLSPDIPQPDGSGGARRGWAIVTGLQELGHEVIVATVGSAEQQPAIDRLHERGIETVIGRRPVPMWREVGEAAVKSPRTLGVLARESFHRFQASVFATELRPVLQAWLAKQARPVDVGLVEQDWMLSEFVGLVPPGVPCVAGFENTAVIHRRASETTTGLRRHFEAREATKQTRDLAGLSSRFIAGTACSAIEAEQFVRASGGLPCSVVPNVADTEALAVIPVAGGSPGSLLFSGSLGYLPNADGAYWLATEVLPKLPGAVLTIVGRDAPQRLLDLAGPSVLLPGFVPEIEPYLADAQVYLAGLLSGAGTKLKVVEALAAGRPMVATSVAAEGLDLVDGVHALIADGANAFAAATTRLLEDRNLATRLATAGRAHVDANFSRLAAARALEAQFEALLAKPA